MGVVLTFGLARLGEGHLQNWNSCAAACDRPCEISQWLKWMAKRVRFAVMAKNQDISIWTNAACYSDFQVRSCVKHFFVLVLIYFARIIPQRNISSEAIITYSLFFVFFVFSSFSFPLFYYQHVIMCCVTTNKSIVTWSISVSFTWLQASSSLLPMGHK